MTDHTYSKTTSLNNLITESKKWIASVYRIRLVRLVAALVLTFSLLIAAARKDAIQNSWAEMNGFTTTEVNLGEVHSGTRYEATFDYQGDGSITNVRVGCGCTVPSFSSKSLKAAFTPNKLHAGVTKRFDRKKITVSLKNEDGTTAEQELFITATVVQ